MDKKWLKSKTLWFNLLSLVVMIVQGETGFVIEPEEQGGLIIIINMILRAITKEGLKA
jgi:hypothetical protein